MIASGVWRMRDVAPLELFGEQQLVIVDDLPGRRAAGDEHRVLARDQRRERRADARVTDHDVGVADRGFEIGAGDHRLRVDR